jgi:hypothetical protein
MSFISDIIGTWRDEVIKMLPPIMRGESVIDWLASLVSPVQTGTDNINDFEVQIRRRLKYNGQIMVLQAALDEIFGDGSPPFIRIETNRDPAAIPAFFYDETDGIPTAFFFDELDVGPTTFITPNTGDNNLIPTFRVLIPIAIHTPELEESVRVEVQLYKIAGKLFEITTY